MGYVATHEIDDRPVHDHKTGEQLSPHLVMVGRQTEHDAMTRHQMFESVPIAMARGKKIRCQWLDEVKERANGPFVRSRLVAMKVAHGVRFDTFVGTAPLKCIKIIISQELRQSRTREEDTHVCLHHSTSALRSGMHCCQTAAWRRRSWIHVASETSEVRNETNIASLPGTHEGSSQRSKMCSTQGMSPSLLLP